MVAQDLEEHDREIVHGIDASAILKDHEQAAVNDPRSHLFAEGLRYDSPESRSRADRELVLHLALIVVELLSDIWVIRRQLPQPRQTGHGLLASAFQEVPTGTLLERDEADDHESCRNKLKGNRNKPLPVSGGRYLELRSALVRLSPLRYSHFAGHRS